MRLRSAAKRLAGIALFSAALVAFPVIAQEQRPSGAATVEKTGESGAEKPGILILQWINFAILAGVLGWLAKKYGAPYFAGRARGISEGLAAGEKARAEAEARAKAVNDRLANLQNEIGDIRSKAREEREREADRIRRDTAAEIARIHAHAGQEIESTGKQARLEVQRFAARLAIEMAERKVRSGMTGEVQAALVDRFVRELPDGAARAQTS